MRLSRRAVPVALAAVLAASLASAAGFAAWRRNGLAVQAWLQGDSPSVAPAGQRPFEVLSPASFQHLRDAFNAHPERTRVLALLSPT